MAMRRLNASCCPATAHRTARAAAVMCMPTLLRHHAVRPCSNRSSAMLDGVQVKAAGKTPYPLANREITTEAPTDQLYDAIVIGAGMGGLSAAAQLVNSGVKVLVLEKYLVPGGSAAHFERDGYTFDVGSSMMFGFGEEGTTNLITRALLSVGRRMITVPDPTQVHYHLPRSAAHPQGLDVRVWRDYERFLAELSSKFPTQRDGIRKFYDRCWSVFNSLNVLDFKSLEEARYLLGEFVKHPLACLTLAANVTTNTGDVARQHISNEELLRFIDMECYIWSTVSADLTPLINAGMVFCDRHFGGINYPVGGVGQIAEEMANGVEERGGRVVYKAAVRHIITEVGAGGQRRAVGVRLADGREFRSKVVVSNATRWDTFGQLLPESEVPPDEKMFRERFVKAPSFLSLHVGVDASAIPQGLDVHHIVLEDWQHMYEPRGTLFVSIPTLLDPSLAPAGRHIVHAFTPDWVDAWGGLQPAEYERRKQQVADQVLQRLEASIIPGLRAAVRHQEVGTPRTHRRYLNRQDGTYGPIPSRRPLGMLSMPMNSTSLEGLYCVGDSTFPGQGVNAVVFSGFGAAHRALCDLGIRPVLPALDKPFVRFLNFVRDRS